MAFGAVVIKRNTFDIMPNWKGLIVAVGDDSYGCRYYGDIPVDQLSKELHQEGNDFFIILRRIPDSKGLDQRMEDRRKRLRKQGIKPCF